MASLSSLKDRLKGGMRRISSGDAMALAAAAAQSPCSGSPDRRFTPGPTTFGPHRPDFAPGSEDDRCDARIGSNAIGNWRLVVSRLVVLIALLELSCPSSCYTLLSCHAAYPGNPPQTEPALLHG